MPLKSCELDPIPASLFSACLPQILPFLTEIVNSSLTTGIFPSALKTAIVRPLLKKQNLDPNNLKNYRPVSNLPFLSKLLEKIVLRQLNEHLSINDLLHPFQSAYRANHSTETALVQILNDLLLATDSGKISLLTLLDLSAAFDTIDHTTLLSRLQTTFGIHGTVHTWFKSYITGRFQSVLVADTRSDLVELTCGVPQGSVLGPVLFTLYTAPLANIIMQHNIKFHFYADDTQLYNSVAPENISALLSETNDCYADIQNWMTANKLKLNGDKTEALLVGTQSKLSCLSVSSLQLGENSIPLSDTAKNLGVVFDNTLSMKKFIAQTCQSCYYQLRRISSIRKFLTIDATTKLVTSLILSRLDYCNSLLSGLPASSILRLQRIQNSAARLILKKKRTDHVTPLLQALHWLPVSQRISFKLSLLSYKCLHKSAPLYLCDQLHLYTPSRSLRSSSDTHLFRIPRTKHTTTGSRSFSVAGPTIWNNLPLSVRQIPVTDTFKRHLKTHLFTHQ